MEFVLNPRYQMDARLDAVIAPCFSFKTAQVLCVKLDRAQCTRGIKTFYSIHYEFSKSPLIILLNRLHFGDNM